MNESILIKPIAFISFFGCFVIVRLSTLVSENIGSSPRPKESNSKRQRLFSPRLRDILVQTSIHQGGGIFNILIVWYDTYDDSISSAMQV